MSNPIPNNFSSMPRQQQQQNAGPQQTQQFTTQRPTSMGTAMSAAGATGSGNSTESFLTTNWRWMASGVVLFIIIVVLVVIFVIKPESTTSVNNSASFTDSSTKMKKSVGSG